MRITIPRDLQNIEVEWKQNGITTSQLKTRKKCKEIVCFMPAGWLTNLPRFQEAWPDHMQVESSCCCFPSELASFVHHIAWENSCPSSLPAQVAFCVKDVCNSPQKIPY